MEYKVYDTSALLNLSDSLALDKQCYISTTVLSELENIKTSFSKDGEIKLRAREVIRLLRDADFLSWPDIRYEIDKLLKKYKKVLEDKADSRILLETYYVCQHLNKEDKVIFYTGDFTLYLLAKKLFEQTFEIRLVSETSKKRFWNGYKEIIPTEQQWLDLSNLAKHDNIFDMKINEYGLLKDTDGNLKEICRWDGHDYVQLGYRPIKSQYLGNIEPRNIEQKCYFDLLQNPDIPVVNCIGRIGTGKTFVAAAVGLDMVERGIYNKMIYVRNNFIVEDTKDVGALPGTLDEKLKVFMGPIIDILGDEYIVNQFIEEGKLEQRALQFMRGTSIKSSYVLVDESQNLTPGHIKMLISRMAENSKMVFCGDYSQIDSSLFRNQKNGLLRMDDRLQNNELYGQIRLKKIERSKVCQMADLLD